MKDFVKKLAYGPLSGVFSLGYNVVSAGEYMCFSAKWKLAGAKRPTAEDAALMREHVTLIYKSFERQKQAKRLYRNIQSYYPGIKVIIADDSRTPLDLQDEHLEVIHLPFNSGLSFGLNRALEKVSTPYVIRMDDDELLTPYTCFEKHLRFLMTHPQVDLVGVLPLSAPWCTPVSEVKKAYYAQPMNEAPRRLKIPHMTHMESGYTVLGKVPNIFIARIDVMRNIGYDDHIRMIDHNDFFYRAAGRMVSVLAEESFIFHDHNRFNRAYQRYRSDVAGDRQYIAQRNYLEMMKHMAERRNKHEGNTTPEAGRNKQ